MNAMQAISAELERHKERIKRLENALRILSKRSKRLMDLLYDHEGGRGGIINSWDSEYVVLYAEPVDSAVELAEKVLKGQADG